MAKAHFAAVMIHVPKTGPAILSRTRRAGRVAGAALLLCAAAASPARAAGPVGGLATTPVPDAGQVLFESGRDGCASVRIPAWSRSARGRIVAVAEGRRALRDHAANDLLARTSDDDGRTWSPVRVLFRAAPDCLNNPCLVALADGRTLIVFQRYPAGFDEHAAEPGLDGPRACRCLTSESADGGLTWSSPRDITRQVKRPAATSLASGPGAGIQLRRGAWAGRVVVPFNQGPYGSWEVYAAFSDDGGRSWCMGEPAPGGADHRANEVQMVELADGSVLLNARGMAGARRRKVARSLDGARTWSPLSDQPELVEPRCMASVARWSRAGALAYVGPHSERERAHGTLWTSLDEGRSWTRARELVPGYFGYACAAELSNGDLGVLYEAEDCACLRWLRVEPPSATGGS